MKKIFFLFSLCLIPFAFCFSQEITVVDSATKQPIAYVTVKFGDKKGVYTNEQGKFSINSNSVDFLRMTHLSYNDLHLGVKEIKDTIFMIPKITVLDEIIIAKANKPALILEPQRTANNFGSFMVSPQTELITIINPNEKIKNSLIKEVSFYFSKNFEKINEADRYKNINAIIRINIYEVTDNRPETKLYSSLPRAISSYSKDNITINLKDNFIKLTDKGICFGIEMIGYSDGTDLIDIKSVYVRPTLTEKSSKLFSSNTYFKYIFDDDSHFIPIGEILKRGSPNKEIERNLVVGLTVIPE